MSRRAEPCNDETYLCGVGTTVFARDPIVKEFDLGQIIKISTDQKFSLIKWAINGSTTWIPRIAGCFQSADGKRQRKKLVPFLPTEEPTSVKRKQPVIPKKVSLREIASSFEVPTLRSVSKQANISSEPIQPDNHAISIKDDKPKEIPTDCDTVLGNNSKTDGLLRDILQFLNLFMTKPLLATKHFNKEMKFTNQGNKNEIHIDIEKISMIRNLELSESQLNSVSLLIRHFQYQENCILSCHRGSGHIITIITFLCSIMENMKPMDSILIILPQNEDVARWQEELLCWCPDVISGIINNEFLESINDEQKRPARQISTNPVQIVFINYADFISLLNWRNFKQLLFSVAVLVDFSSSHQDPATRPPEDIITSVHSRFQHLNHLFKLLVTDWTPGHPPASRGDSRPEGSLDSWQQGLRRTWSQLELIYPEVFLDKGSFDILRDSEPIETGSDPSAESLSSRRDVHLEPMDVSFHREKTKGDVSVPANTPPIVGYSRIVSGFYVSLKNPFGPMTDSGSAELVPLTASQETEHQPDVPLKDHSYFTFHVVQCDISPFQKMALKSVTSSCSGWLCNLERFMTTLIQKTSSVSCQGERSDMEDVIRHSIVLFSLISTVINDPIHIFNRWYLQLKQSNLSPILPNSHDSSITNKSAESTPIDRPSELEAQISESDIENRVRLNFSTSPKFFELRKLLNEIKQTANHRTMICLESDNQSAFKLLKSFLKVNRKRFGEFSCLLNGNSDSDNDRRIQLCRFNCLDTEVSICLVDLQVLEYDGLAASMQFYAVDSIIFFDALSFSKRNILLKRVHNSARSCKVYQFTAPLSLEEYCRTRKEPDLLSSLEASMGIKRDKLGLVSFGNKPVSVGSGPEIIEADTKINLMNTQNDAIMSSDVFPGLPEESTIDTPEAAMTRKRPTPSNDDGSNTSDYRHCDYKSSTSLESSTTEPPPLKRRRSRFSDIVNTCAPISMTQNLETMTTDDSDQPIAGSTFCTSSVQQVVDSLAKLPDDMQDPELPSTPVVLEQPPEPYHNDKRDSPVTTSFSAEIHGCLEYLFDGIRFILSSVLKEEDDVSTSVSSSLMGSQAMTVEGYLSTISNELFRNSKYSKKSEILNPSSQTDDIDLCEITTQLYHRLAQEWIRASRDGVGDGGRDVSNAAAVQEKDVKFTYSQHCIICNYKGDVKNRMVCCSLCPITAHIPCLPLAATPTGQHTSTATADEGCIDTAKSELQAGDAGNVLPEKHAGEASGGVQSTPQLKCPERDIEISLPYSIVSIYSDDSLEDKTFINSDWVCPQHHCHVCNIPMTSSKTTHRLKAFYRCEKCQLCFCESCLPADHRKYLIGTSDRIMEFGYELPEGSYFFLCSPTCVITSMNLDLHCHRQFDVLLKLANRRYRGKVIKQDLQVVYIVNQSTREKKSAILQGQLSENVVEVLNRKEEGVVKDMDVAEHNTEEEDKGVSTENNKSSNRRKKPEMKLSIELPTELDLQESLAVDGIPVHSVAMDISKSPAAEHSQASIAIPDTEDVIKAEATKDAFESFKSEEPVGQTDTLERQEMSSKIKASQRARRIGTENISPVSNSSTNSEERSNQISSNEISDEAPVPSQQLPADAQNIPLEEAPAPPLDIVDDGKEAAVASSDGEGGRDQNAIEVDGRSAADDEEIDDRLSDDYSVDGDSDNNSTGVAGVATGLTMVTRRRSKQEVENLNYSTTRSSGDTGQPAASTQGLSDVNQDQEITARITAQHSFLPDILQRVRRGNVGRFRRLGDIPRLKERWLSSHPQVMQSLVEILVAIEDSSDGRIIGSVSSDNIMEYGGVNPQMELAKMALVTQSIYKSVIDLKKDVLTGICAVLGLAVVTQVGINYEEPKFRFFTGSYHRSTITEALAAFLVNPHSQNMLLRTDRLIAKGRPSNDPTQQHTPAINTNSIFCIGRYLEALSDPIYTHDRSNAFICPTTYYIVIRGGFDTTQFTTERNKDLLDEDVEGWVKIIRDLHLASPDEFVPPCLKSLIDGKPSVHKAPITSLLFHTIPKKSSTGRHSEYNNSAQPKSNKNSDTEDWKEGGKRKRVEDNSDSDSVLIQGEPVKRSDRNSTRKKSARTSLVQDDVVAVASNLLGLRSHRSSLSSVRTLSPTSKEAVDVEPTTVVKKLSNRGTVGKLPSNGSANSLDGSFITLMPTNIRKVQASTTGIQQDSTPEVEGTAPLTAVSLSLDRPTAAAEPQAAYRGTVKQTLFDRLQERIRESATLEEVPTRDAQDMDMDMGGSYFDTNRPNSEPFGQPARPPYQKQPSQKSGGSANHQSRPSIVDISCVDEGGSSSHILPRRKGPLSSLCEPEQSWSARYKTVADVSWGLAESAGDSGSNRPCRSEQIMFNEAASSIGLRATRTSTQEDFDRSTSMSSFERRGFDRGVETVTVGPNAKVTAIPTSTQTDVPDRKWFLDRIRAQNSDLRNQLGLYARHAAEPRELPHPSMTSMSAGHHGVNPNMPTWWLDAKNIGKPKQSQSRQDRTSNTSQQALMDFDTVENRDRNPNLPHTVPYHTNFDGRSFVRPEQKPNKYHVVRPEIPDFYRTVISASLLPMSIPISQIYLCPWEVTTNQPLVVAKRYRICDPFQTMSAAIKARYSILPYARRITSSSILPWETQNALYTPKNGAHVNLVDPIFPDPLRPPQLKIPSPLPLSVDPTPRLPSDVSHPSGGSSHVAILALENDEAKDTLHVKDSEDLDHSGNGITNETAVDPVSEDSTVAVDGGALDGRASAVPTVIGIGEGETHLPVDCEQEEEEEERVVNSGLIGHPSTSGGGGEGAGELSAMRADIVCTVVGTEYSSRGEEQHFENPIIEEQEVVGMMETTQEGARTVDCSSGTSFESDGEASANQHMISSVEGKIAVLEYINDQGPLVSDEMLA